MNTVTRAIVGAGLTTAVTLVLAGTAAAAEPVSALVTHYDNAPGHGPSVSAICVADGIDVGYHPWDHGHRNFQLWDATGALVVNTTEPDQHWTVPVGAYTVRYVGKAYQVDGSRCDTTGVVTTPPAPPVVEVTTPPAPPVVTTQATTPLPEAPPETVPEAIVPPAVELTSTDSLPVTGSSELPLVLAGLGLVVAGGGLVWRFRG